MRVNFYLKAPNANYPTWIYCHLRYQDQKVKVYTDQKTHPKDWSTENQQYRKTIIGYSEYNDWLKSIEKAADKIEMEWKKENSEKSIIPTLPSARLKEKLKKYLTKISKEEREENKKHSFWGYYDNFLYRMENGTRVHSDKGTPMAAKTIAQFHNLKRHLKNFEKKTKFGIEFENIDMVFYKNFVDYLTIKLKLAPNTIGKLITNLKVYMREALEDGLTTNTIFTYRKFKSINFKSDTVYLTKDEIKALQEIDLTKQPRYERVRDMFVIGCHTGLRFGDLSSIEPQHIEDGMITLKQEKTSNVVIIPMTEEVIPILEKYNNHLPKISNQKYNEYLHEVCKKCEVLAKEITIHEIKGGKKITKLEPKYNFVTSHTARRSMATNEYRAGDLSISEIMAITGHKTEKAFYKYIRVTPKEVAERIKEKFIDRQTKRATITNHLKAV